MMPALPAGAAADEELIMGDGTVLLITGVGSYWGASLAGRLLQEGGKKVIGIDRAAPKEEIPGLDFIPADSRNPHLAELLRSEQVSALCHLDFTFADGLDHKLSQRNAAGLENVLGACAEAGVSRVILKSSTAVYGARPDNSSFLTEESPLRAGNRRGYLRDLLELEATCNGFQGQRPDIRVTVLRFANIVGTRAITPMTRFLSLHLPPILLGYDPIMQLVHEEDVIEAMARAMLHDGSGVFNVAAADAMPLSRILRLARRLPLPISHRLAFPGMKLLQGAGLAPQRFVPIPWDHLRYSLVADLSAMNETLAFSPAYTAAESLREFDGRRRKGHASERAEMARDEQRLQDILKRRSRERERQMRMQSAADVEAK
jgi:UDP-glucose 4-epimerase